MIKTLLTLLGLSTALLTLQAEAIEALFDPSSAQGRGYSAYYTGFCSERVGVKVIGGRETRADGLPGLVNHAQQSVKNLLAKCPNAREIAVDVRSSDAPTLASYFTMSRENGWTPSEPLTLGQLKSWLEDEGYELFAGPRPIYSVAYWRFVNNRFDAFYGNDLENRLVATHVERAAGDYRLRGQIFDLGYNESGRSCPTSREGYALWGSFTMTVSPKLASLPMDIKWCAESHESGEIENTEFFAPGYDKTLDMTLASLTTLLATTAPLHDASTSASAREALIDREFYRVYATRDDMCSSPEFDVIYRVNHEQRDSVFAGHYISGIGNVVGALAARRCGGAAQFVVNGYSVGDTAPWDTITFAFDERAGMAQEVPFRVKRRLMSEQAKVYDENQAAMRFGPCDGAFCTLPGGRYLNAIYRGDLDVVRQIDALHREAVYDFVSDRKAGIGLGSLDGVFDPTFDVNKIQLLEQVANKYMHAYAVWGEGCLDPGSQKQHYEYTTPVVVETDEYGTTTSGGITFETSYTLNPEFFELRDKLASYRGAKDSDDPSNLEVKGAIYRGIVDLVNTGDCRSAEVKQFERELRRLTGIILETPGVIPPTDAVRPPRPQRVVAAAFPAAGGDESLRVPWNSPAPLPRLATAGTRANGAARPLNEQQRMAKMSAEMTAAQKKLEADMTAIQVNLAQARQRGVSPAELMSMMQAGQMEMMQLQQRFQEEMARIQSRYQ